MRVKVKNIETVIVDDKVIVNLKWLRGAGRYNNGGNNGGKLVKDKYPLRIIFGRLKQKVSSKQNEN